MAAPESFGQRRPLLVSGVAVRAFIACLVVALVAVLVPATPASAAQPSTPVSITTTSLPDGEVSASYSKTIATSGGKTPFSWSVSAGSLPAGLSLGASTGVISGTPTTVGSSTFTIQVTDKASPATTASQQYTVAIVAAVSISTTSLANGQVSLAYSQSLSATSGSTPYTWTVSAGSLPAGLTLSSGGTISGTPTTAGTSTFTAKVTDALGGTATKSLSIAISGALGIATTSLPSATANSSYSATVASTGGQSPIA